MTWFKVDDGFYDHPKVKALPRGPIRKGAISLWNQAGSWSSRYLKDGEIPLYQIEELGWSKKDAEALVGVALWHAPGHSCPDCPPVPAAHYVFHQWGENNPTRDQVESERKAARDRVNARRRSGKPPEPKADVHELFGRTSDERAGEQ